jgi:hypothetical protein
MRRVIYQAEERLQSYMMSTQHLASATQAAIGEELSNCHGSDLHGGHEFEFWFGVPDI